MLVLPCALAWMAGAAVQMQQAALGPRGAAVAAVGAGLLMLAAAGWVGWAGRPAPVVRGGSGLAWPWGAWVRGAALAGVARAWVGRVVAGPRGAAGGRRGPAWPREVVQGVLAVAGCALLAWGSTAWRAHERLAQRLPASLEGRDLVVVGIVDGLPQLGLSGARFHLEVESARDGDAPVTLPGRISLGWMRGFDADALLAAPPVEVRAGQRWELPVRLRRPHGLLNPHGFDLELWMFEQGLGASGYVRDAGARRARLLDERAGAPLQRLRQQVRDAIVQRVDDPMAGGVVAALVVGDQAAIARDDWDLFRVTGVAHLMSISGLHVTMFAWLAGALVGALWRRVPRAVLALPAPVAARWGGLACAAAYALFAGWGVPAQRTVWMLATLVAVRSLGARWPPLTVLGAAGGVVTLADPWALRQPGFWLSFVAVGLLMSSEPVRRGPPPRARPAPGASPPAAALATPAAATAPVAASTAAPAAPGWSPAPAVLAVLRRALPGSQPAAVLARGLAAVGRAAWQGLRTQLVATVGLAPLTLVFFQQLSLIGFVANLLAIPLVTLAITPLGLLGVVHPPLWSVAGEFVGGLVVVLQALGALPGAVWHAAVAPPWAVVAGLAGGVLAVLPLPWRLRLLALPLVLPLLWPPLQRPQPGQFEAVAVDVGQGTAVLVRTREHLLVYDSGPQYSPESDAGQRVLLPLLLARGDTSVDLLMLSHRDTDHTGGASALLAHAGVRALSSSLERAHPLRRAPIPHRDCAAGQRWSWDGVQFELLHPAPGEVQAASDAEEARQADDAPGMAPPPGPRRAERRRVVPPNTLSCVLRVRDAAGRSLLLTGDIEARQELRLLESSAGALAADVLLVPHHGSRTSSTPAFIDAVAPSVAVVQAAYRSRFNHPAPAVVARYEARGITLQRSDRCGAWIRRPDGSGHCHRRTAARYWHHPGDP